MLNIDSLIFKGKGKELESLLFYIDCNTRNGSDNLFWDLIGERYRGWDAVLESFDKKDLCKIVYDNKENFNINDYIFYIENGKIISKSYDSYYSNIEKHGIEILKRFLSSLEKHDKNIFERIETMEDIYIFARNYD